MKKKLSKRSEALFPVWQRDMNPEQLAAIMHDKGPARLLAAAGSGKTRVVTHRIARLVSDLGVDPSRILALTFSKKAADEMSKRVEDLDIAGCRVGTWHSLCLQILKQDKTKWSTWEVREASKIDLKDVTGWKGMDWKGVDINRLSSFIARCKANLFSPDSPDADVLAGQLFGCEAELACIAFHKYNERLEEKEVLTFDDFLVFTAEHLEDEVNRETWAAKWDYVIQDEAQDENQAQRTIAKLLAGGHRNYMVVGDVFQAIYGFRGSSPAYLATFDQSWEGAVTYWLPRNYRSVPEVIDAANGIVCKAKVPGIDPQNMVAERKDPGEVRALASETLDDEANNFVSWISTKTKNGDASFSDITALFRTNAQSRALEEALLGARIPYVVVGGTSFYERKEVRDILAYLRIACGRGEFDDVKRCINAPFRYLGAKFVDRVLEVVERLEDNGQPRTEHHWSAVALKAAEKAGVQRRQVESAKEWAALLHEVGRRIKLGEVAPNGTIDRDESRPHRILDDLVRKTKYIEWITKEEGEESIETSGAANVREMIRVASRFPTCDALLDYVDETIEASRKQRNDKQAGGERVLLMSVHRSKGLEWPHVWVAGFNEMVLPHIKGDPEEERRLAYVAVTRARDSLVMSYVRTLAMRAGIKDAQPSRFLRDSGVSLDTVSKPEPTRFDDEETAHAGPAGMIGESPALPPLEDLPN